MSGMLGRARRRAGPADFAGCVGIHPGSRVTADGGSRNPRAVAAESRYPQTSRTGKRRVVPAVAQGSAGRALSICPGISPQDQSSDGRADALPADPCGASVGTQAVPDPELISILCPPSCTTNLTRRSVWERKLLKHYYASGLPRSPLESQNSLFFR